MWKLWFAPISWDENPAFQIRSSWAQLSRFERFWRSFFFNNLRVFNEHEYSDSTDALNK
jgi:hypothetical protein